VPPTNPPYLPFAPKALVHYEPIIIKGIPVGVPSLPLFNELNLKDYLEGYKSSGAQTISTS